MATLCREFPDASTKRLFLCSAGFQYNLALLEYIPLKCYQILRRLCLNDAQTQYYSVHREMNKVSLLTVGKKLQGNLYLLSIYDLEPSGLIVQAYDQIQSKEYLLPVSEKEVRCVLIRTRNAPVVTNPLCCMLLARGCWDCAEFGELEWSLGVD
jgi:hypothetical protein